MRHGKPCQIAKQSVIAGLKWPPETGAQVMMANAMPIAKAQPIWKIEPKTGTPTSLPAAEVVARVKDATEAIPGKLKVRVRLSTSDRLSQLEWGELRVAVAEGSLHVEKDSSSFSHTFSEDPWTAMLEVELALRDWLGSNNVSG